MSQTQTITQVKSKIDHWYGVSGFLTYNGPIVEKKLMEGKSLTAMDVSGSTGNELTLNNNNNMYRKVNTILDVEKSILSKFSAECLAWSEKLNGIYPNANDSRIKSEGGTSPASIFTSEDSNVKISNTDILIMSTDGEIEQNQVQIFSNYLNKFTNIKMFIGVLAGNKKLPSQMNISVFASMMNSDCIIVHSDNVDGRMKLLYSNGAPSLTYPCPVIKDKNYDQLTDININELVNLRVMQMDSDIPEGYISLSDKQYVNFKLLFEKKDIDQDMLMKINYQSLLMLCKTQNRLKEFRQWFNSYKPNTVSEFSNPIETQISRQLNMIRSLLSQLSDPIIKPEIRNDLEKLLATARQELPPMRVELEKARQEYQKLLNVISQDYRRFHDTILMDLHNIEKATYDLGDVRSNRAARAERIQETINLDQIKIDEQTYRGEDSITLDENQIMALIVREPVDMTTNTSDFALSWPFAVYNQEMASPDYISLEMAKHLTKQGNDLTRNQVLVYVPVLNLQYTENRQYIKQQLCKAFLSGRDMSHCWRLFYSYLYNCYQKEWSEGPMREMIRWYMNEILTHHKTTETFTDEGVGINVVPLRKAIPTFLSNSLVQQHPINSVMLMVNSTLLFKLDGMSMDKYKKLVREKFVRYVSEMILSLFKKERTGETLYNIKRMFYDYRNGVPLMDSGRMITYSELMNFFKRMKIDTHFVERNMLFYQKLSEQNDINTVIEPELISVCLGMFMETSEFMENKTNFQQYRPETLFEYFLTNPTFIGALHQDKIDCKKFIDRIFGSYHRNNSNGIPSYATIYGPSVLVFNEKYIFIGSTEQDTTFTWGQFDTLLRESRREYYRKTYKCDNTTPTKYSSNFNLHSSVASVLLVEPDIQLNRATVLRVLAKLIKCNGNIYIPELLEEILFCVNSFKQVRANQVNGICKEMNLIERAKLEFELRKIPYDNNGVLLPKNFNITHPLTLQYQLNMIDYAEVIAPLNDQEIDALYNVKS